ncbi:MAG: hypothetical protein AB7F22_35145 [Reyranella sp.]|uniref:hypothetical protein n=1 Tax=Reyranella sp. TaxID=1929291 RepID=UPI003D126F25
MFERTEDERLVGVDPLTAISAMLSAHEMVLELLLADALQSLSASEAHAAVVRLNEQWAQVRGTFFGSQLAELKEMQRRIDASRAFLEILTTRALRSAEAARAGAGLPVAGPG